MADEDRIMLEITGLKKKFGEDVILDGVDLTINKGEVVVMLGSSGCGKSTLLRCINGLESFDKGSIRIDGEEIVSGSKNLPQLRQKIGMVFQSYDLFPHMNVMDNLLLGPVKALKKPKEEVEAEAVAMLKRVGLEGRGQALPRTLSGGQKQRVALVRAMLMHPELLLLDEITAALDPEMVSEVLNVVIDLAGDGMTMAIVTHEMRFAEAVADQVLFLEQGSVVEQGTPEQFFHDPQTDRAKQFLQSFTYTSKRERS